MRIQHLLILLAVLLVAACQAALPRVPSGPAPAARMEPQDLFLEAEQLFHQHQYRQAQQAYAAYLKQQPEGPNAIQARFRQAEISGLLGDWQGALKRYQELLGHLKEGESALKARFGIGRAYFKLGNYPLAQEILENLTASELPRSLKFPLQALLTEIALRKGEIEPAFVRLRLAERELAAGDQEWFEYLKNRLVEQATPQELEHLANLYRDSPLTAPLLLRLARLAQEGGRPEEAAKWSELLKERFPDSPEARMLKATLTGARPVIGCLLPLSGEYASYGSRLKQGLELAAEGRRLEVIYRDCPNDPAQAVRAVKELAADPRVLTLLGPLTSADAQAAAETAQASGIPLVALSQKPDLTAAGPLVFQLFLTPRLQVRALLHYALKERNWKNFAVLAPDSAYGRALSRMFREELAAQGGNLVVAVTYPPETQDFTFALHSLAEAGKAEGAGTSRPEAIFMPDDAVAIAAFASQLRQQPWGKMEILGTNVARPQGEGEKAPALNGLLFTDGFFAGDPLPEVQEFVRAYRQRYGSEPDYLAAQGYMAMKLMAHLLETWSTASRAEIPGKLASLGPVPHIPWFKGFTPDRQAALALYILTLRDGQVEMLAFVEAASP